MKDFLDFVSRDNTGSILVKHLEGSLEVIILCELGLVHSCDYELRVVDEARSISVDGLEHLFNFIVGHHLAVVVKISVFNFIHRELSIPVGIESLEDLGKIVSFIL